jgi:hypothetical protein
MTVGGRCYQRPISVPRICASGSGSSVAWPTPTVHGNYNRPGASQNSGLGLATAVRRYPTPCADDAADRMPPDAVHLSVTGLPKLINSRGEKSQVRLSQFVKMIPTPKASDSAKGGPNSIHPDLLVLREHSRQQSER